MKANQITIVATATVLLLTLIGCEPTDGHIALKEPKPELSEMPPPMIWDASDPDKSRQAVREPDGSFSDPLTGLPVR